MKEIFLLLYAFTFAYCLSAQDNNKNKTSFLESHPIEFEFGNYATSLPFIENFTTFHPQFCIGFEHTMKQKEKTSFYQSFHAGMFNNNGTTRNFYLNTGIGYRYTLENGLFANGGIELGYMHAFRNYAIFKLNDNDEYDQAKDFGKPYLITLINLSIGYDLSQKTNLQTSIFFSYKPFIQLPYNLDIPVLPQNLLSAGVRFYLK